MTTPNGRTLLVYGATGRAGQLVVERALLQGWAVSAFVRNPDKVPTELRSKVTIVKGDLCDAASVAAAVRSRRPHAIVDASSALPFGHAKGQPANNADRGVSTKASVEALEADGRCSISCHPFRATTVRSTHAVNATDRAIRTKARSRGCSTESSSPTEWGWMSSELGSITEGSFWIPRRR